MTLKYSTSGHYNSADNGITKTYQSEILSVSHHAHPAIALKRLSTQTWVRN